MQEITDFLQPLGYSFVEELGEKDFLFKKNTR